jgi:hypothetical protein
MSRFGFTQRDHNGYVKMTTILCGILLFRCSKRVAKFILKTLDFSKNIVIFSISKLVNYGV